MKKAIGVSVLVLIIISLTGCGPRVTRDEAKEAWSLAAASLGLVSVGNFLNEKGDSIEGAHFSEERITFTGFDLTRLPLNDTSYRTLSGVMDLSETGGINGRLTFKGGPVKTMKLTVPPDFNADITVVANGQKFILER